MRETGRAIMLTRGNNTHSGNLALRDPDDRDVFHITASGSQLGALVASDIVPVHFSRVSWGDGRASTESTIHRKILALPGVEASIHAHYLSAISVSFDAKEAENFLLYEGNVQGTEEFSFVPVDRTGAWLLGRVPSGTYLEPVGSKEMEARIPRYLADSPATLVKGHGPFVRGRSLEECLHVLGVVDASATLLQAARFRGVDTRALARRIRETGLAACYAMPIHLFFRWLPGYGIWDAEKVGGNSWHFWGQRLFAAVMGLALAMAGIYLYADLFLLRAADRYKSPVSFCEKVAAAVGPGDEIQLILPYVVAKYTVTRVIIVLPDEVEVVRQLGREQHPCRQRDAAGLVPALAPRGSPVRVLCVAAKAGRRRAEVAAVTQAGALPSPRLDPATPENGVGSRRP